MPVLGLGTWLMGGDTTRMESPQDTIDIDIIRTAIDRGINHIDTAEIYAAGYTEELVGRALRTIPRDKVFLASKATKGHHDVHTLPHALDETLKRLQTDYLDLYYLHQPTFETPFQETAQVLNKAIQSGKIRSIGVCNFSAKTFDALQSYLDTPIVVNQVHYNLAFREPETAGLLDHAQQNDYFMMAWRPLKFKKRNNDNPNVGANAWDRGVFTALDAMADAYGQSNVATALQWVLHHPHVITLIKTSNPRHLYDVIKAVQGQIKDADYQKLKRDFEPVFYKSDTVPLQ